MLSLCIYPASGTLGCITGASGRPPNLFSSVFAFRFSAPKPNVYVYVMLHALNKNLPTRTTQYEHAV